MVTEHTANLMNLNGQLISTESNLAQALRDVKGDDDIEGQNKVLSIRNDIAGLRGEISSSEKESAAAESKSKQEEDIAVQKEQEKISQEQEKKDELTFLDHPPAQTVSAVVATKVDPTTGQTVTQPVTTEKSSQTKSTTGSSGAST